MRCSQKDGKKAALVKRDGKREQGISGREDCANPTQSWEYPGEDPGKEKDPNASSETELTSVWYRSLIAVAVFVFFWLCVPPPPDGFSAVCGWPFRFEEKNTSRAEKYLFFGMKLSFWQVWLFGHFLFFLDFFQETSACQNNKYKDCNVRVLSSYVSSDNKEVLMVAQLFLISACSVEKPSWASCVISCVP